MKPRVFIADDNVADAELLRICYQELQVEAHFDVVKDGKAALAHLKLVESKGAEPPTLIFLDLNMPKVKGIEVLRYLRSNPEWKDIRTCVLTSSHDPADRAAVLELGAEIYIKPTNFDDFLALVGRMAGTQPSAC